MTQNLLITIFGAILGPIIWLATGGCLGEDGKLGLTCQEISSDPNQEVYYVVSASELDNEELFTAAQQDPESVRFNIAGTHFILKYNLVDVPRDLVNNPPCIPIVNPCNKPLGTPRSNSEMVELMSTTPWIDPNPDDPFVEMEDGHFFVEDDNFIIEE